MELLCQRISKLGGINISEQSAASVAAAALVAQEGPARVHLLADDDIDNMYKAVKASNACMSGGDHRNRTGGHNRFNGDYRFNSVLVHCIRRLASRH